MGNTLPPLAQSVVVGSTAYRAGDIPPLKHARRITNRRNWEGGETPDFENGGFEDGVETVDGVGNGDAANHGRTGLPGFDSNGSPKQLVTETGGDNGQLLRRVGSAETGDDPETGQGGGSTGDGAFPDADDDEEGGSGDGAGSGESGTGGSGDTGTGDTGSGGTGTGTSGATATATATEASTPTSTRAARRAARPTA